MSGSHVIFVGDAMAVVVQGIVEAQALLGWPPVIVGGLAVLSRLSNPYRATVDLDLVDRLQGKVPQLEVLRAADGAEPVEPAAVLLPTEFGSVKVDVLEVRQIDLDRPSDDPGDRLHAFAHAWAHDTATDMTIEVIRARGARVEVTTPVAEPGPLIAMKLQAVMNRSSTKQGTDLLDTVHLTLDNATRPTALDQLAVRRRPNRGRRCTARRSVVHPPTPAIAQMDPGSGRLGHHHRRHRSRRRTTRRRRTPLITRRPTATPPQPARPPLR